MFHTNPLHQQTSRLCPKYSSEGTSTPRAGTTPAIVGNIRSFLAFAMPFTPGTFELFSPFCTPVTAVREHIHLQPRLYVRLWPRLLPLEQSLRYFGLPLRRRGMRSPRFTSSPLQSSGVAAFCCCRYAQHLLFFQRTSYSSKWLPTPTLLHYNVASNSRFTTYDPCIIFSSLIFKAAPFSQSAQNSDPTSDVTNTIISGLKQFQF